MGEAQKPTGTATGDGASAKTAESEQRGTIDLDRVARKYRKEAEAARTELETVKTQLKQIEESKKTDQEKAIETAASKAREEANREWEAKLATERVSHRISARLARLGLPDSLIHTVAAETEISSPDEVDAAVDEWLRKNEWTKKIGENAPPHGQGGSPSASRQTGPLSPPWTHEKIRAIRQMRVTGEMTAKEWAEISPKIEAALKRGEVTS